MGPRPRLRTRVAVIVAVGALLVAAGLALVLRNTIVLHGNAQSASRAQTYLLRLVNLERLVGDDETGLRGYVITGRPLFLQPLNRAQAELPAAVAALQTAAAENHAHRTRVTALAAAVHSYMTVYVPHVVLLAAHQLLAARSFAVTLQGKREVDDIRARVAELERLVSTSQARRQETARSTANRSIAEAITVLVLLTLLTAGFGGYLGYLAVERERARRESEETTQTLQRSILPSALPAIHGCELATRFIPSGGAVSGDFYDVVEIAPAGWALIIGDVCGKGAQAAASTAMARWTLRSSLALGSTPADALRFLNQALLRHDLGGRFITAACLKLMLSPDSARLAVACAGHPAPVFVPASGAPSPVSADGDLLGIMPTIRLHTAEVELRLGESLVAYTDGVTDQGPESRRSPEQALANRPEGASAEQLAAILEDLAHQPQGRHPDDIAILALRFVGSADDEPPPSLAATAAGETQGI